jgi:ABC-type nitrate/sulfonate/bicarbonate transport system permease component
MQSENRNIRPDFYKRKRREQFFASALGLGVIAALLIIWEIAARTGLIDSMFSSCPSKIIIAGIELFRDGQIQHHAWASSKVFILGFLLSAVVGIPVGIISGWSKWTDHALSPLISALNTTPRLALMPLLIVWFGLGFGSKIVLVFLSAVFPIVINMQAAMLNLDEEFRTVAKSYGATRRQLFTTIALPASVPFLITGLRMGIGRALLGIIAAEVFGGGEGIGFLIQYAGSMFQVETVFVCVVLIGTFGIVLDRSFQFVSRSVDHWRSAGR